MVSTLRKEFHDVPVGYSGHESDMLSTELAVSLGADVVERHITLDRTLPGSDQKASIEISELERLIARVRDIESRRGTRSFIDPKDWARPEDLARVQTLLGDGVKKVFPREVDVMKKLRRVADF